MTCIVAQRQRAHAAAAVLESRDAVLEVSVLGPSADPTDDWLLDVLLADDADGLNAKLCEDCADYGLTVRSIAPQGPYRVALLQVA